jgi:hypothetical protein
MCRELLPDNARQCRKCQTDLSLLSDYTSNLRDGLSQAEASTRAGELGEAMWAYLAVLEVDPDNSVARRQVGRVVTAVRQFDARSTPDRQWARKVHKEGRFRRFMASMEEGETSLSGIFSWVLLALIFAGGVAAAYYLGYTNGQKAAAPEMKTVPEGARLLDDGVTKSKKTG